MFCQESDFSNFSIFENDKDEKERRKLYVTSCRGFGYLQLSSVLEGKMNPALLSLAFPARFELLHLINYSTSGASLSVMPLSLR